MKTDLSLARRSASDARVALQSARRQQEKHLAETNTHFSTRTTRGGNTKPRASSARAAHGARPTSAFGATVPKETFVGPPMSPESFRATMHDGRGQNAVIHTSSGLHASIKPHNKNAPLTSPEVVERVRVERVGQRSARRLTRRGAESARRFESRVRARSGHRHRVAAPVTRARAGGGDRVARRTCRRC